MSSFFHKNRVRLTWAVEMLMAHIDKRTSAVRKNCTMIVTMKKQTLTNCVWSGLTFAGPALHDWFGKTRNLEIKSSTSLLVSNTRKQIQNILLPRPTTMIQKKNWTTVDCWPGTKTCWPDMVGASTRKSDKIKQISFHNCAYSNRTFMSERSLRWRSKSRSNLTIFSTLLCKRLRLCSGLDLDDLKTSHASSLMGPLLIS